MSLIIAHEFYWEFLVGEGATRDVDADADVAEAESQDGKIYE
jgi:hypothetical protein